jgi:type VI secretion system protein VasJ
LARTFDDLTPLAAAYLAPVPGTSPAGSPARFDPEYQAIAAEVAKLDALAGPSVDWNVVERGGSELLQSRTKDLVLAAYLAQALHVTRGLDGLITGTVLLAGILDRYWDTLQPDAKRMRGRANALQWFLERAVPALEAMPEGSASEAQAEALEVASARLADVTRQRMGDAAPGFGSFRAALARLRPVLAAAEGASPGAIGPGPRAGPASESPSPVSFGGGEPRDVLEKVGAVLVDLASRMREAGKTDPAGYRTARVGLWLHLDASPAVSGGRTRIPAPPSALLQRLALLQENQQWAALLEEAESALPRQRFALDLQRFTWMALQGLGADHDGARAAVVTEVRGLLARMPSLPTLSFSDGTGLADARTKAWIDEVVLARPAPARASGPEPDGVTPAFEDARRMLSEGRVAEALEGLRVATAQLRPGRARFLARLDIARAYAGAGLTALALGTYRGLEAEVLEHGLEVWEPALAVDTLKGLISTLLVPSKDSRGTSANLDDYYRRLCSLDPAAAYEVWP